MSEQNTIIHIPGKCVPQVLVFLKDHLDYENYLELVKFKMSEQNTIIHIPGKCIPQVLVFLKDHLDDENYLELVKLQGE